MNLGTAQIIRADARSLPLADDSVDLVVTSPPYFALRSYTDGGIHYEKQLGSEATPAEFVDALLEVTRECVRVLRPSGSIFVNLGDKYAGNGGGGIGSSDGQTGRAARPPRFDVGIPTKSLMGLPWRYALRCIDDLGLILRAEVIWSKPNGLPESVTDRVRRSHEQWFHFTLEPRYFSAVDEIREATSYVGPTWEQRKAAGQPMRHGDTHGGASLGAAGGMAVNPLGKLPGSVWTVPTEPLRVPDHLGIDHFAAFPSEWPRRIIQGWSPAGVCVECGEGRRPVAVSERTSTEALRPEYGAGNHGTGGSTLGPRGVIATITGYACACPPACPFCDVSLSAYCDGTQHNRTPHGRTTPAVVLDPFGGTGTTALVAKALGRHGVSVDMSADYCRLAEWRTNDRDQLAKVLGIAKAEQHDGHPTLFEEIA